MPFEECWQLLLDQLLLLDGLMPGQLALALGVTLLTTVLVASCVPGVIIPLSLSSGALLGQVAGIAAVAAGALLGSQALFYAIRYGLGPRVKRPIGRKTKKLAEHLAKRGPFYVVGLRLAGTPHFLVTAGSALSPLGAIAFAATTLAGFLPIISAAAVVGSLG